MALAYDFDIFRIIPDFGPSDPRLAGLLENIGIGQQQEAATVALFRDPHTAEALRRAPSGLRRYLLESGFGLNTYTSGAPVGHYPASDEAARLDLINRLAENAHRFPLPSPEDAAEGGDVFRLGAFLLALDQCQPIDMADADSGTQDAPADQTAGPVLSGRRMLPPLFEPDPSVDPSAIDAKIPTRRKFWQSRYFRIGATAVLVLGLMQMASGPALTALASL